MDAEEAGRLLRGELRGDVAVGEVEGRAERGPVVGAEQQQARQHAEGEAAERAAAREQDVQRDHDGDQRRLVVDEDEQARGEAGRERAASPGEHERAEGDRRRRHRLEADAASPEATVPRANVTRHAPPQPGLSPSATRPTRNAQSSRPRPPVVRRTNQSLASPSSAQRDGGGRRTACAAGIESTEIPAPCPNRGDRRTRPGRGCPRGTHRRTGGRGRATS